jgi:hypothetical protein
MRQARTRPRLGRLGPLPALLGLASIAVAPPSLAQQYRFSTGPWKIEVFGKIKQLIKRQSFPEPAIYCFDLPDSLVAKTTTFGLLNGNAITFADYPDPANQLTAFVVTSTLPAGQTPEADFKALLAADRASEETIGDRRRFAVSTGLSAWGPTIQLRMRNVAASTDDGWFPLTRGLYQDGDGPRYTRSTHRLFMRGAQRFEVAVLGKPKKPGDEASEAATLTLIEKVVDEITDSLQRCTSTELHNRKASEQASGSKQEGPP